MRKLVALGVGAMLALGLTACADEPGQDPGYARVCIDESTHERVDGARCGSSGDGSNGFLFWYLLYGSTLPRYGYPVVGGVSHVSNTTIVQSAERAPAGKSYTTAKTRSYSTGAGKKLGTTSGGTGYRAPAPKSGSGYKAPAPAKPAGGGYKAPAYKAPAFRAPAPAYRAPAVRSFR